ncbi:S1 RNA-binding domain-containing protein [Amycolatopsis sp. 195334CR]|uniref:S1 RNA-binding domain-containing protein n=1 Tax=Amycolatopsis sp. 195334CR TaxID=2814588 RepID=UPI001A905F47|nr:S1 RNA-binding domain-containing protein [Amycolatopsis sp. 195334CR]MBN6042030.1 S1 RNA-binding domain-containing protein [Amycolatopsis sp. 195334CR]
MSQNQVWQDFLAEHGQGSVVDGTVASVVPFGAFLEVAPGIHALLHASGWTAEPAVGASLSVRILDIDEEKQRLSVAPA